MTSKEALYKYTVRLGDDALIIGHRVSEWCGKGPILEEDIALTNISLDLIGQATTLLEYAAEVSSEDTNADKIAFLRYAHQYTNTLLCEQPNGDFGQTIARQFFFSTYQQILYRELIKSKDSQLSAIAEKSLKEVKYHVKHSAEWMIRLGDGTEESHSRVQESVNHLWKYTNELFFSDEVNDIVVKEGFAPDMNLFEEEWKDFVTKILTQATLEIPANGWEQKGGRTGVHTEHLGFLLAEMQYIQRVYPNMEW